MKHARAIDLLHREMIFLGPFLLCSTRIVADRSKWKPYCRLTIQVLCSSKTPFRQFDGEITSTQVFSDLDICPFGVSESLSPYPSRLRRSLVQNFISRALTIPPATQAIFNVAVIVSRTPSNGLTQVTHSTPPATREPLLTTSSAT